MYVANLKPTAAQKKADVGADENAIF